MKKGFQWIALLLVFALLAGCGDSGGYVKDNYQLIDVQGSGKSTAKVYVAEGKDVPTVAGELAAQEKPQETSKESPDQMFLVYDSKIINLQKDPGNAENTLVEINSIEYAREHYDSSFLQGYVTATVLQSLFGGGWFDSGRGGYSKYRGYTSSKRYDDYGKYQSVPYPSTGSGGAATKPATPNTPSTSNRGGSFTTKPDPAKTPAAKPADNAGVKRNDGSTPNYNKSPSPGKSTTKPSTGSRSGSFKRK